MAAGGRNPMPGIRRIEATREGDGPTRLGLCQPRQMAVEAARTRIRPL